MTLTQDKPSTPSKPADTGANAMDTAPAPSPPTTRTTTQAPQRGPTVPSDITDNWWYYALVLVAIILIYFIYRVLVRKPGDGKS